MIIKSINEIISNKIIILCGNYGSGKTELSINVAVDLARKNEKVTLVDLDIVNPYFRSSERADLLETYNIELIKPTFANTAVDIPALPADVMKVFRRNDRRIIIDVGGDATGAVALSAYHEQLKDADYVALMVVNVNRPFSSSVEKLLTMYEDIQNRGRIKLSAIINNSNLARWSDGSQLSSGMLICRQLSDATGMPILFNSIQMDLLRKADANQNTYGIDIYMRPEWLDEE